MKIARGTQKPGQSKEQTKLIAQGIQKGIDLYKKQQKSRARELDRKLRNASNREANEPAADAPRSEPAKPSLLPWLLLVLSWSGFAVYLLLQT